MWKTKDSCIFIIKSFHKKINMKKTLLISAALFSITLVLGAQEDNKTITSKITHVTVFTSGAQVTGISEASVPQGTSTLIIRGLSPYIDANSIQVKGKGKFTVLSVSNQINYVAGIEEKTEIENLRKKIEDLSLKIDENKMQISILKEEESFLIANKNVNGKQENLDAANFKSLFDFYKSSLIQIRSEIMLNERKVTETEKELTKLKQQLETLQSRSNLPSGEISVIIKADAATTAKLEINYLVQNAGWIPSYDLRVTNLGDPVSLVYKANVYQNTGVDWNNVSLTFSSASPNISGNLPILHPYYIDFLQDIVIRGYGSKKAEPARAIMNEELNEVLTVGAPAPAPATAGFVASENMTNIEFNVNIPYSIPSEGKPKSIDMLFLELPATYEYQTVPKLSKEAYLVAQIHEWEKYDLLKGESNLYFENTFVGKSVLDPAGITDTMNISLGRDMGIIVKREKRKNFTSEKLIGGNKVVTLSWEISVRNSKNDKIKIQVTDQIPVSQNKEITIEALELSGGKLESKTGYVKWDFELKPGETKNIILTYSAKYPKDSRVNIE